MGGERSVDAKSGDNGPPEQRLVERLRGEATGVKECFTRYSIQSIAFATVVLGFCFRDMRVHPLIVFAPLPVVALLMAVCRIGIYKYTTANRVYGFELHLARTAGLSPEPRGESTIPTRWASWMRGVSWEEAVKAWRIVQVTVFRKFYVTPVPWPRFEWFRRLLDDVDPRLYAYTTRTRALVRGFDPEDLDATSYPWFMIKVLTGGAVDGSRQEPQYHGGSYLRVTFTSLHLMQLILLSPLMIAVVESCFQLLRGEAGTDPWALALYILLCVSAGGVTLLLVLLRWQRDDRRRGILEDELLSIQSCAIVWQAVILAHYRAVADGLPHYTQRLADEALHLAEHADAIHEWVAGRRFAEETPDSGGA